MNIIMFAIADFPTGFAATSRIKLIANCLHEGGHSVSLAFLHANSKHQLLENDKIRAVYNSIEYEYLNKNTVRPAHFFGALSDTIKGMFSTIGYLHRKKRRNQVDAVILYSPDVVKFIFCILICKLYQIPIFVEICEIPSTKIDDSSFRETMGRINAKIAENIYPLLAAGLIVISTKIKRFYLNKGINDRKIFHLPILVDFSNYRHQSDAQVGLLKNKKYLLNSGSYGEKEGIKYVIQAFSRFAKKNDDIYLGLTGIPDKCTKEEVNRLGNQFGVAEKIIFTGFLSSKELIWCYQNAISLICCRSNSHYANYGFPTKLGEYLAAGKPILATKVGDIPLYLRDRENAYLAEPEAIKSITLKMEEIVRDKVLSDQIGSNGRRLAEVLFDYRNYIHSFHKFITERVANQL